MTPAAPCPGSGWPWIPLPGGLPVCPACRRGPKGIGVPRPRRGRGRKFKDRIPQHTRMAVVNDD